MRRVHTTPTNGGGVLEMWENSSGGYFFTFRLPMKGSFLYNQIKVDMNEWLEKTAKFRVK